jgi:hypothetical protein
MLSGIVLSGCVVRLGHVIVGMGGGTELRKEETTSETQMFMEA